MSAPDPIPTDPKWTETPLSPATVSEATEVNNATEGLSATEVQPTIKSLVGLIAATAAILGPIPTLRIPDKTPRDRWWNRISPSFRAMARTEDGLVVDSYGHAYRRMRDGSLRKVKP